MLLHMFYHLHSRPKALTSGHVFSERNLIVTDCKDYFKGLYKIKHKNLLT